MVKIFLYPISQTVTNTQSSHQRGQIASVCVCVILPVCALMCVCVMIKFSHTVIIKISQYAATL